ncbi:MAG TPA: methyltransferase [Pseudolabrys sp.]|jgi:tRNA (cmo5U34)-methyltransferase|nr:methyltransferase [Pseudolabrys sp.]
MTVLDFNFAEYAFDFDAHISASIPGYDRLRWWTAQVSRRFVKQDTRVIDIGCSTGSMLREIRDINQASRPRVEYVGIDISEAFRLQWKQFERENLGFKVCDATRFVGFYNSSLVIASFALQFIAEHRRVALLKRIHDGLVGGGALLIAEKTLATSSALQDVIAFTYYDYKRLRFSADDILDKERRLRGVMTPWTRGQLFQALSAAGFSRQYIEPFWQEGPFISIVAIRKAFHGP